MVFRLSGDFKYIQQQMLNLLEWTRKEYTGEVGDGGPEKLSPEMKKKIKTLKEKIDNAKTLEDFEQIVIEFTCNYETFFKKESDTSLLVATCNNYNWDDVDKEEVYDDEQGYYDVAGYTHYIKASEINGYTIYKREYDGEDLGKREKKLPKFVFPEKGFEIIHEDSVVSSLTNAKFVVRGEFIFQINNNRLEKIPEVKDEKMLNKLKLLMNLE